MQMKELNERLEKLEYHQKLLLGMINPAGKEFDLLVIKKQLSEKEVMEFLQMCEELSQEMENQKAENFVFYSPLFKEFASRLNKKLYPAETIQACLMQRIFPDLMEILSKNL